MAVVSVFEIPEQATGVYDEIINALEDAGAGRPEGRLYHVTYAKEGGYVVVSVWESVDFFNRFAQTLMPLIRQAAGTAVEPHIYPVVNIIR